jgi:hypothetical protein
MEEINVGGAKDIIGKVNSVFQKKGGPGDPPKKTPEYKNFQTDSLSFDAGLKGNQGALNYIKEKYPINWNLPADQQDPKSMQFLKDFKKGYSGKKTQ